MRHHILGIMVFIAALLYSGDVYSQSTFSDYLEETSPEKKSEIGLKLWNEYLRGDLDSLKVLAVNLILDASELEDPFMRSVGQRCLGSYYLRVGKSEESIVHLIDANNYFDLAENFTLISETYNELGNAYLVSGDNKRAIDSYLLSIKMGKEANDPTAAFNGMYGLGKAYYMDSDTALAIFNLSTYKNEAVKMMKFEAAADAYAYMGMIELDRGNTSLSEEYYGKSIYYSKRSKSLIHLSHAYTNQAILHFNLGNKDSSEFYFEKSLELREALNRPKETAESYYNLGSFYMEEGSYDKAKSLFGKSINLCREYNLFADEIDAHDVMLEIAAKLKDDKLKSESEDRISQLKKAIDKQIKLNDEIILYAENSIDKLKENEKKAGGNSKASNAIWIVGVIFFVILILGFWKQKWVKY